MGARNSRVGRIVQSHLDENMFTSSNNTSSSASSIEISESSDDVPILNHHR